MFKQKKKNHKSKLILLAIIGIIAFLIFLGNKDIDVKQTETEIDVTEIIKDN